MRRVLKARNMKIHICSFVDDIAEGRGRSGKLYRWEFSEMFGPTLIGKNGDPLKNQPINESHDFWTAFTPWHMQRLKLKHGRVGGCC